MKQDIDELAKEMRRDYYRKWRAANKDKVRRHNANYWRKKAEQRLRQVKEREEVKTIGN